MTLERFWDFVDNRQVVRRLVLVVAVHLTYVCTYWAMHFAETSTRTGIDFAALVAAVTAPATAFAAFVFKVYIDGKSFQ